MVYSKEELWTGSSYKKCKRNFSYSEWWSQKGLGSHGNPRVLEGAGLKRAETHRSIRGFEYKMISTFKSLIWRFSFGIYD